MIGQQSVVKAIVEKPDSIYRSKNYKERNTYYKRLVLPSIGNTYIRVVVLCKETDSGNKKGYVINAFACNGSQRGEKLLWEKKK